VVSAILGPFAIPLAVDRRRVEPPAPLVLQGGRARTGPIDVRVGVDGSARSTEAAEVALALLGPRVRRVTLASVLDFGATTPPASSELFPDPYPEDVAARELLGAVAGVVRTSTGIEPGTVVLAGDPADALERHALEEGYDVLVVGCRGRGLSKRLLGSCAAKMAAKTSVPVLLIPSAPTTHLTRDLTELAASPRSR
jgi:nucleotide-binding universal stress UspA family protein